jgi:hypothetical protein
MEGGRTLYIYVCIIRHGRFLPDPTFLIIIFFLRRLVLCSTEGGTFFLTRSFLLILGFFLGARVCKNMFFGGGGVKVGWVLYVVYISPTFFPPPFLPCI